MAPKYSESSVVIHIFAHVGPKAQRGYAVCSGSHRSTGRPKCLLLEEVTWKEVLKKVMSWICGEAGEPRLKGMSESLGGWPAGPGGNQPGWETGKMREGVAEQSCWQEERVGPASQKRRIQHS